MNILNLAELTDLEVDRNIKEIKDKISTDLFIPVHHYQRNEIVQFADYTGDSLELSRVSAQTKAKYIVFCGVYFMAEIARVLSSEEKMVFMPNRDAGCPLAEHGNLSDIRFVWDRLQMIHQNEWIPVTYANSHADVKAFCGRYDGLVCTSSNVKKVFQTILNDNKRIFFMPDKNLGVNTAVSLGMENDFAVVDRESASSMEAVERKRIAIWNGYCYVHTVFTVERVKLFRERDPEFRIIVHPECNPDVVREADVVGSTSFLKRTIEESEPGSKWVVGTETIFVNRLKEVHEDKVIEPLDRSVCLNMSMNRRRDLLKILMAIQQQDFSQAIVVPPDVRDDAKKAISRMLEIS
ncbi:MAG: quinolinate synthase NadA [Spirochaetota bacterium]|nr:MAG: quinolinate synthase NadA [Spirochaetota bacterium]